MWARWGTLVLDALLFVSVLLGLVGIGAGRGWPWCSDAVFWRGMSDAIVLWFIWIAWWVTASLIFGALK